MKKFSLFLGGLFFLLPHLVSADSMIFSSPGNYIFTVPLYQSLSVSVSAGGGGGSSSFYFTANSGGSGGSSAFDYMNAQGGGGGSFPFVLYACSGVAGAPGSGSGGTVTAGGGGAGGSGNRNWQGNCTTGGPGGAGGLVTNSFGIGSYVPGSSVSVTVGAGGAGGVLGGAASGGNGGDGSVAIYCSPSCTYVPPLPASCTVSISPNPATYSSSGTATLTWSSSNADTWTYITSVGYLSGSGGSFTIPRTATADYSCYAQGSGGSNGWHAYTFTVTSPAAPTASITSSRGTTMQLGQFATITATFTAAGGDTLTHDNIDSPLGNGVGADTDPGTKTYTFTPIAAGTYTFYARAQTSYFTSWATYNTLAITVQAPCTLNGTTIQSGDSATFYSQQLAPSGRLCSSVSQTRTCTNGVLSGSDSYQYSSCTCAPLYSCSGSNVTFTDNSCSVTTVASCVSPAFCSAGISSCQLPAPSFNAGAGTTGHIQAKPQVLSPGKSAVVSWNLSNVSACSVSGSNGDSWTGASGSKTTSPISQRTVFTLSCTGLDASKVSETAVVNVTPTFQEQ